MADNMFSVQAYKDMAKNLGYDGFFESMAVDKLIEDSNISAVFDMVNKLNDPATNQAVEKVMDPVVPQDGQPVADQVVEPVVEQAAQPGAKPVIEPVAPVQVSPVVPTATNPAVAPAVTPQKPKDLSKSMMGKDLTEDPEKIEKISKLLRRKVAGGPGSGSNSNTKTKKILDNYKGLSLSPITSIGKRSKFMKGSKVVSKDSPIAVSKIKYVIQDKYVPSKVKEIEGHKDLFTIDVVKDKDSNYHVLDGHHRFLAAKEKGLSKIPANVYKEPKTMSNLSKKARKQKSIYDGSLLKTAKEHKKISFGPSSFTNKTGLSARSIDYKCATLNMANTNTTVSDSKSFGNDTLTEENSQNILPAKARGGSTDSGITNLKNSTLPK